VDAIAVGAGTILADDPLLTARGAWRRRPLARVIFDRSLRTPAAARVFSTSAAGPVIIVSTASEIAAHPDRVERLERAGAEVEPSAAEGLGAALACLGARGITSLLVEGGPRLHAALARAGLIDAWQLYCAPVVAGPDAVKWLDTEACALTEPPGRVGFCGPDVRIQVDVHRLD
jgi:diaminohydroxyphosphoribosylaminopyrimidine deaminase/5-amino-6-(5-phosphoribosylamino)uracil reductase